MMLRTVVAAFALLIPSQARAAEPEILGPTFIPPAPPANLGQALLGPVGPTAHEVAGEVRRRGFWAGRAIGEELCSGCHPDVAAQWRTSAHRFSSFNNPYYRLAAEEAVAERGPAAARFCAGCHDPVLAATRLALNADDRATPVAQAGITCMACHAIEAADLTGNGRYRARPEDTFPIDQPFHRQRLRAQVLSEPRACGVCHNLTVPATLTGAGPVGSQDDFQSWSASPFAGKGTPRVPGRPAEVTRCQDCHMPLEPAPNDLGAKDGVVRSHRFLTANAALPHLRGDANAEARVRAFLRGTVIMEVSIRPDPAGHRADVSLVTRQVGHRFPGGTMDSNQVWLEVTAFGRDGAVLGASGRASPDGRLPADAHLVRAQAVDGEGRPITRRDQQHARGIVFDQSLSPRTPRQVRFALPPTTARVTARLLYRKFSPSYAAAACRAVPDLETRQRCEDVPVVEVATAQAEVATAALERISQDRRPAAIAAVSASHDLRKKWAALHPEAAAEADDDHVHALTPVKTVSTRVRAAKRTARRSGAGTSADEDY